MEEDMRRSVSHVLTAIAVLGLVTTGGALVEASASARARATHPSADANGKPAVVEVDGKRYELRGDRFTPVR
jgi:hypothetical protein